MHIMNNIQSSELNKHQYPISHQNTVFITTHARPTVFIADLIRKLSIASLQCQVCIKITHKYQKKTLAQPFVNSSLHDPNLSFVKLNTHLNMKFAQ